MGKRNDFEACVVHLLKYDPVVKRCRETAGQKRGWAEISGAEEGEVSPTTSCHKAGSGKAGVYLRYHTTVKYKKLTREQKNELCEWRNKDPASCSGHKRKKRKGNQKKAMNKKAIAALVA